MKLASDVLQALAGKTLATAESCTGGGIGSLLTAVPGASAVFKGGVISYCNEIKRDVLGVEQAVLDSCGAVSAPVAKAMAAGAKRLLQADFALSVTGLAGPGGDEFGNPVGTVFIGCAGDGGVAAQEFHFSGDRDAVRQQAIRAALEMILTVCNQEKQEG